MSDAEKLQEIHRLLDEAYRHYFENSDGCCKSSEGAISLHYGNYWDRAEDGLRVTGVEVYSYVLGPSRSHYFKSLDEALATVRQWHKSEMEFDHAAAEAEWERGLADWEVKWRE